jgi:hypothetical protein
LPVRAGTRRSEQVIDVPGFDIGTDAAGRELIQPFRLKKAAFKDAHQGDDDEGEGEEEGRDHEKSRAVSTIMLQVAECRRSRTPPGRAAPGVRYASFVEHRVVPDKKASFGIERSVSVGPTVAGHTNYKSGYKAGALIKKLEVRYRTPKFFQALQCRIDPRGISTRTHARTHARTTIACALHC